MDDHEATEQETNEDTPAGSATRLLALRAYVDHEGLRYGLSAGAILAITLLVPELLNNMVLTLLVLLLGVSLIPELLRKRR